MGIEDSVESLRLLQAQDEAAEAAAKVRQHLQDAAQVQDARDLLLETVGAALVTLLYHSHAARTIPEALLTQINDLRVLTGRDTQSGLRGRSSFYGGD